MTSWFDELSRQVRAMMDAAWEEAKNEGLLPMLRPIAPFNQPGFMAPLVTVSGVVSLMLLSGVAVGAFGAMLVAMFAIYLLLVQVFGVSIELHPLSARA